MRYLVTGAGGFIGAAVVDNLIKNGHECVTIDNFSTGYREHVPKDCILIEGNTHDESTINKLMSMPKFDAIIHIAGQSSGEVSFINPVYDLQSNVQSTLYLLNFAKSTGVNKFIYTSSMAVYGEPVAPPHFCTETTPTIPKSLYAVGKLASENYMRIYSNQYGIKCIALRLFNVYGIGQNLNNLKQGMASIYLAQAIRNHHVDIKGSAERFRDFIYIDDVVEAIKSCLNSEVDFDIFNVCTDVPTKVSTVIKIIQNLLPFDVTTQFLDGTPGDQFGIYGSNDKICNALSWKPTINFDNGMKLMVNWAMEDIYSE